MANQKSYFELHAGFPDDPDSANAANSFLHVAAAGGGQTWTRSEVTAVYMKSEGCLDPHNVPGTLGTLVSCAIRNEGHAPWKATVEEAVLPTCASALKTLGRLGSSNARLEIECPFGWMGVQESQEGFNRERSISEPIGISPRVLKALPGAMPDVPQWEIHFVAEPRANLVSDGLSIKSFPALIEQHGVDIEQTIQYRSHAMLDSGTAAYKFISTAYFATPADVVREATRVFDRSSLVEDVWSRGFGLSLILEHIVGCFKPITVTNRSHADSSIEVHSAR